jgi:tetratricopeptide (TPR) repeat protein
VVQVEIDEEHPDIAHMLPHPDDANGTIYFISGLERASGLESHSVYGGLNLYREIFVENRIKVVFWLTANEASKLPRLAPDFWAFRHRVIEFASPLIRFSAGVVSRLLMWHEGDILDSPDDLQRTILDQEKLLASLPKNLDSLAMRMEACYMLGRLYWTAGDSDKALKALIAGSSLARHESLSATRALLVNGVAIIRHEQGKYQEALEIYQNLLRENPVDGILCMNMGLVLCSTGKNSAGISQSGRAVIMDRSNSKLWNRLGHLHLASGHFDDAIPCFEKAIEITPTDSRYRESLAACYSKMGLVDEALEQIRRAGQLEEEKYARNAICEQAILGNTEEALDLLRAAIRAGQISAAGINHDPNLNLLMDPVTIARAASMQEP